MPLRPGPQPIAAVIARDTTETPPKGAEIHRVRRDWGEEISFVHKGRIERVTVTKAMDAAAVKKLVAFRRTALDIAPDHRAELEEELALHEEEVARIKAQLKELD